MPAKKKSSRNHTSKRVLKDNKFKNKTYLITGFIIFISIFLLVGSNMPRNIADFLKSGIAARPGGGSYDNLLGCAGKTARPCYDKLTGSDVNLLGKNGENVFTSCSSNAAPNIVGEFIHKTTVCGQEKVTYCHDGKSSNFIRKFSGACVTEPPPPPPPSPEPTTTSGPTQPPTSAKPFRITYPNGGEQLPFGSYQTIRWEGGDTTNDWPIYLSIVDRDRNTTIREMVINTPNDGQENWIVDLPLGNYYVYYGQGCRNASCVSTSEWDQSDAKFSVVAGSPLQKIDSAYPLNKSLVSLLPSGNEIWNIGSQQTIRWSGGTSDWKISISLISNSAWTTYTTLFSNLNNTGEVSWNIPEYIPPGDYKMYISCSNCGSAPSGYTGGFYIYSFYPFKIQ